MARKPNQAERIEAQFRAAMDYASWKQHPHREILTRLTNCIIAELAWHLDHESGVIEQIALLAARACRPIHVWHEEDAYFVYEKSGTYPEHLLAKAAISLRCNYPESAVELLNTYATETAHRHLIKECV